MHVIIKRCHSTIVMEDCYQYLPQTRGFVTGEILHVDPEEGIERLQDALKVCLSYKRSFAQRKDMLPTYFKDPEVPLVEWSFQPDLVFSRLDRFVQQLYTIQVRALHVLY